MTEVSLTVDQWFAEAVQLIVEPYLQEGHTQHAIDLLLNRVQSMMATAINEPQEGSHFDMQSELKNIV